MKLLCSCCYTRKRSKRDLERRNSLLGFSLLFPFSFVRSLVTVLSADIDRQEPLGALLAGPRHNSDGVSEEAVIRSEGRKGEKRRKRIEKEVVVRREGGGLHLSISYFLLCQFQAQIAKILLCWPSNRISTLPVVFLF